MAVAVALTTLGELGAESVKADDAVIAHFDKQVEPILLARCLSCHADAKQGGLDLRARSTALAGGDSGTTILSGNAEESLLFGHVSDGLMPPDEPLSPSEVAAFKRWIDQGAYYPDEPLDPMARTTTTRAGYDWWSLQPLNRPDIPNPPNLPADWRANNIDHFVYDRLVEQRLTASPPADPTTLLRRAKYDLWGLPPTPDELAEFVAACLDETGVEGQVGEAAYRALLDRLLASPRYGEQWGRRWLDIVRFGESNGFERNVIHSDVWPFRDYVIEVFNNDKPFDQVIREHLAADTIDPENPEVAVAATFLVCGPYDNVGNQDAEAAAQIRADTIDEMIRTTSEAFLGLTVGCSRCHDHKFDPISQQDYYQLYATFAGVTHNPDTLGTANSTGDNPQPWKEHFHPANGPFHVFEGGSPQKLGGEVQPASPSAIESAPNYKLASDSPEPERRRAFADWLVRDENPLSPRVLANRLWQGHFGRGIVATPSDFGFLGAKPSHPKLLDYLAAELQQADWRLKPIHKQIMLSQTYRQASRFRPRMAAIDGDTRLLWRYPPRRLAAEELRDSMLVVAGKLNFQMGGPGFRLFEYVEDNVATYHPLDEFGEETYRRSVYQHKARATQIDLMSEFDAPDCAFATPRRSSTTTPLQALTLLNHDFTFKMAEALAERVTSNDSDKGSDNDIRPHVERVFQLILNRSPQADEFDAAVVLVETHGLKSLGRALFNSNEFLYLD